MDKIQNTPLTGDAANGTIINEAAENAANAQEVTATESGRPIDLTEQLKPEEKKIPLINLGPLPTPEIIELKINDAVVKVKRRIPYEEVLDMIQWCIDLTVVDKPFLSAPLEKIVKDFAVLKFYTNIDMSFVDSALEIKDLYAGYDVVTSYHIIDQIWQIVEAEQVSFFNDTLQKTLESIIKYKDSAKGIIDAIAESARENTSIMDKAMEMLNADPKMRETVTNVLTAAKEMQFT